MTFLLFSLSKETVVLGSWSQKKKQQKREEKKSQPKKGATEKATDETNQKQTLLLPSSRFQIASTVTVKVRVKTCFLDSLFRFFHPSFSCCLLVCFMIPLKLRNSALLRASAFIVRSCFLSICPFFHFFCISLSLLSMHLLFHSFVCSLVFFTVSVFSFSPFWFCWSGRKVV